MSKIVFFCIPAHGHTNPTLGVVRELIARGHEVFYYSYEMMRGKIEETGASFIPCDRYDPQMNLSKEDSARIGKDLAFSTELIVNLTLALDDAILADMKAIQPDVIVSDSMAFWGKLIAKKLEIPFVSSTTTFAFNKYSARVMKQEGPGLFSMIRSMPKIGKSIRRLQEKGYEVKSVLDIIANNNDTKTICYTSSLFQPYSETFSDNYDFVGPIVRDLKEPFKKGELPLVYISLGTVDNNHPEFYENCLAAVKGQPYRVIISAGQDTDISKFGDTMSAREPTSVLDWRTANVDHESLIHDISSNVMVKNTVDQIAVLQCADAFLTHCGMNSVSEALYYGVPLVLFPQSPEQHGVANRVKEMHAGTVLENTSPEGIQKAIRSALDERELKDGASAIAKSFRDCGGAGEAADFIERQCK